MQETFVLKDALFYTQNEYNNSIGQLTSNIPTNFKATFKMKYGTNGVGTYLQIGEENKGVLIGHYGQNRLRIFAWNQGSGYQQITPNLQANTYYTVTVTYNNGVWTVECNNQSMTWSNTYTTRTYIGYRTEAQGYIKDIIIETL